MAKRITFEFPDRSHERLKRLKEKTESSTYADVVRQSLQIYEWLIDQVDQGGEFYVRDANGETSKVPLFLNA